MLGQVGIWGDCRVAHGLFVVFLKVFLSSFSVVSEQCFVIRLHPSVVLMLRLLGVRTCLYALKLIVALYDCSF